MPSTLEQISEDIYLQALMEGAFSGALCVDAQGRIAGINDRARAYLDCRYKEVSGMPVCHLFPLLKEDVLNDVLRCGDSIANYYVQNRTVRFVINIEPVGEPERPEGAMIVFQKQPLPEQQKKENLSGSLTAGRFFSNYEYASELFQRAVKLARYTARFDTPILFVGEKGTEIPGMAKCVHNESGRRERGYAELDCSALSREQLSHLLFEQSADTGEGLNRAVSSLQGGTLLLSHIDRLSSDLQYRVNLLIRGQYIAENDILNHPADIRVLASTDKNLKEMVRQDLFREDLYYALSATTVTVPPLRERGDDVIDLANMFVIRYSESFSKPVKLTKGAFDCIRAYSWPGNVEELDAFCRRLVLSAPRHSINEAFIRDTLSDLRDTDTQVQKDAEDTGNLLRDDEAARIRQALRRNGGSKKKTADELGISKVTLWRRMQKYGICD